MKYFVWHSTRVSMTAAGISIRAFLAIIALISTSHAQLLMPQQAPDPCNSVVPPPPVEFHGKVLKEAAEITDVELLTINAQISTRGCRDAALSRFAKYRTEHPDNYQSAFVEARLLYFYSTKERETKLLVDTLAAHPEFSSAKVLLGSLALERYDYRAARSLLGQAIEKSPNDLWANIHLLEIDARENLSMPAAKQLLEIAENSEFGGFPREAAAVEVMGLSTLPLDMREKAYRVQLKFASATPISMKTQNLGRFLIEERHDYAEGRRVLTPYLATEPDDKYAQVLLAESYLFEAQAISPFLTPANAGLIAQAKGIFSNGDLSPVAARIGEHPELSKIQPLIAGSIFHPDATDQFGHSALCNSLYQLNAEGGATALNAGADPNGMCEDRTIMSLVLEPSANYAKTAVILELLLKRGVDVDSGAPIPHTKMFESSLIEVCQADPACREKLMPILKKYSHAPK